MTRRLSRENYLCISCGEFKPKVTDLKDGLCSWCYRLQNEAPGPWRPGYALEMDLYEGDPVAIVKDDLVVHGEVARVTRDERSASVTMMTDVGLVTMRVRA